MRREDLHQKQIKRILIYWLTLSKTYNSDDVLEFMSEVFSLTPAYMFREIICKHDLKDMEEVLLPHIDLDKDMIQGFAEKLHKKSRKERQRQMELF